jgi:hypothetical protein
LAADTSDLGPETSSAHSRSRHRSCPAHIRSSPLRLARSRSVPGNAHVAGRNSGLTLNRRSANRAPGRRIRGFRLDHRPPGRKTCALPYRIGGYGNKSKLKATRSSWISRNTKGIHRTALSWTTYVERGRAGGAAEACDPYAGQGRWSRKIASRMDRYSPRLWTASDT